MVEVHPIEIFIPYLKLQLECNPVPWLHAYPESGVSKRPVDEMGRCSLPAASRRMLEISA